MDSAWISRLQTLQDVNDLHNELYQEHGRSYYRGRRGSRLVCFCPDHGYIPKKNCWSGSFWSVLVTSPRLILRSGYGDEEVLKPEDDAEEVLCVMNKHGFHHLSEEAKLHLLWIKRTQHRRGSVWQEVLLADKINTMIALLSLTPLFAIAVDNIPPHEWIENSTWIRKKLYEKKLRWKPNGCRCKKHNEPSNDGEKLCALTSMAFTMFAADLFYERMMQFLNTSHRCSLYLLQVAPNLLTSKVPRDKRNDCLTLTIYQFSNNPDTLDFLMKQVTNNVNVGEILKSLMYWANVIDIANRSCTKYLRCLIHTLVGGKEEELKHYRDDDGSSILHIACRSINLSHFYWLKELLHIGLDPSVRNREDKTALDILITCFFTHFWPLIGHEHEIDNSHFIARSIIQAVHMFLPAFKGTPIFHIKFPQLRSIRYTSVESINTVCVNVYSTFFNSDIFPNSAEKNLASLLVSGAMYRCKSYYPCLLCKPLVQLMLKALHMGLNLHKHVNNFRCGRKITLPETFLCLSLVRWRRFRSCTCHIRSTSRRRPEPCDCCGWQLLELMVNCKANLDHMVRIEGDGCHRCKDVSLLNLLSDGSPPLTMSNVITVIKLIWMYQSDAKIITMDYLHKIQDDISDTNDRRVENDLEDLMQAVRPLKLLCRICVLQHIQWKDIKHLPMPARLIQYLKIGDISNRHVVYKVL